MEVIAQGAEAILRKENGKLVKERIKKFYRIDEIDKKLRKYRTRYEAKLIERSSKLISVPRILNVNEDKAVIEMEFIEGKKISDVLDKLPENERKKILKTIGNNVAILHNNNIIHGDLTTSNMILKDEEIYFIDFGLGFVSNKTEDKAVDIHLLKQALESKHYQHFEESYHHFLEGYKEKSQNFNEVLERLKQVEKRGRYKRKT